MNNLDEIIVQKQENSWLIFVLEENRIVEKMAFFDDFRPKVGDILKGTIKNINKKSGAIFIDIGYEKLGYLEAKKLNQYVIGEEVLVQVNKAENGKKGPKLAIFKGDKSEMASESNSIEYYILNNLCKKTTKNIYVNDCGLYQAIEGRLQQIKMNAPKVIIKEKADFIKNFGMLGELEKAEETKIWLKSGGYIVIDKTEALWAIDVNSGKYEGKKGEEKPNYVLKINKEAATEVMRQVRLKNMGGIIVVDFINMKNSEDKKEIISLMKEEAKKDRSIISIYNFSKLGLLELTRKKL